MAKLSLAEMSAKLDEDAHNSNISNLAHALRNLDEAEREAETLYAEFQADVSQLRVEISKLAEMEAAKLSYEDVRKPYDRAQSIRLSYNKPLRRGS